jgi:5-methyltetrahydrofolate--homocysteine methyltransferase
MAAVVAASRTELPTWAVVECLAGGELERSPLTELLESLNEAGASVVLFEVPSVEVGLRQLERGRASIEALELSVGILLAASSGAIRGFEDPTSAPERWAERALELSFAGARVIGGGAGTTEAHTRALAQALGSLHPSVPVAHSDGELNRDPSGL